MSTNFGYSHIHDEDSFSYNGIQTRGGILKKSSHSYSQQVSNNSENQKMKKVHEGNIDMVSDAQSWDDPMLEIELRSRGSKNSRGLTCESAEPNGSICVDRAVKPGDTLQKIALQYQLPIAELKRLNNLMTEQDFYALSFIKIPVKEYSHAETLVIDDSCPQPMSGMSLTKPRDVDETPSEGSDAYLPFSDTEMDMNYTPKPNLPSTSSGTGGRDWEGNGAHSPASLKSNSSIGGEPATEEYKKLRKMLKSVDANVEKAKTVTSGLQSREALESDEAVFNGDMIHMDMRHLSQEAQSKALENNLRRYLVAVLVVFVLLVPVGYFIYEGIRAAENDPS